MSYPIGYPTDILTPRCVVKPGLYTVITPDTLCRNNIPCFENCTTSVLASPRYGAGFAFYRVEVPVGVSTTRPWAKEEGIESFTFVYEGKGQLIAGGVTYEADEQSYLYTAPGEGMEFKNTGSEPLVLLMLRQRYVPLEGAGLPGNYFGKVSDLTPENLCDMENVQRYKLLPGDMSMDLCMIILSFQPGGCHNCAETHLEEHGMYVLEGEGAYWLGDNWSITKKDDFVWMGPFCPQAAYCVGKNRYTYLLTKDCNRDVPL